MVCKRLSEQTLWRNAIKWYEQICEDNKRADQNRLYTKLEELEKTDDDYKFDYDNPSDEKLQVLRNDPSFDTNRKELSIGHIQAKVRDKEKNRKQPKEKLGSIQRLQYEAQGHYSKECSICGESIIIKKNRPYTRTGTNQEIQETIRKETRSCNKFIT